MKADAVKMAADLLYPPRCPICGQILEFTARGGYYRGTPEYRSYVHRECFLELPFPDEKICERCGMPVTSEKRFCETCMERERSFDGCRSVFLYEGNIRTALSEMKYKNRKEYAGFFSFAAVERLSGYIKKTGADLIVPVPVHKERMKKRGYNQAALLAERIGHLTGIPVEKNLLIRKHVTEAQKELTPADRKKNLADAFSVCYSFAERKTVLLVDDIYTTGATMEACARVLAGEAKAFRVYGLCMATSREKLKNNA